MPDLQPPQSFPPQVPPAAEPGRSAGGGPDPLAGLKKMSTTAGLGSGDYVAINPVALTAFLLGAGSLLVPIFNGTPLLLIPTAGVLCALIALRQIGNSNGTQTGRGLAFGGLALSLLIGGGMVASRAVTAWRYGPDRRDVAGLIRQLGQEIAAAGDAARSAVPPAPPATGPTSLPASRPEAPESDPAADRHYQAAYQLFSDKFRSRVDEKQFKAAWAKVNPSAEHAVRGMEWNGIIDFAGETGSGAPEAWATALVKLNNGVEPPRQPMLFTKVAGVWQIDDIPALFPPAPRALGGAGPGVGPKK